MILPLHVPPTRLRGAALAAALPMLALVARGQSYAVTDLIVGFDSPGAANQLELNLGPVSTLPTSGSLDLGNVSALLTRAGLGLSTASWSVAAQLGGSSAGPVTAINGVTYLPGALWFTQQGSGAPASLSFTSAQAINGAIATVGTDIGEGTYAPIGGGGLGSAAFVVPTSDTASYTNQVPYGLGVGFASLETAGPGTASFWALNASTPGTAGKAGSVEGNLLPLELGSFTLSSTGELAFEASGASPAPSTEGPSSRIANVSSRAFVQTGASSETIGVVVTGPAGSTEPVLVRAVGPTLSQFGLGPVLAQPVLTVFDAAGNPVASNAGWSTASNASAVSAAAASAGAFPLGAGSADSALLLSLAPGVYTAQVTSRDGTSGVVLAEVYETASGGAQLVNGSTLAVVGSGTSAEIGGLVLEGGQPSTVLIRAVGPTLASFGVSDVLSNPTLTVMDARGNVVGSNTGWGTASNASAVSAAAASSGAFPLGAGSADSALLLTLPPGAYTAVITGGGGSSGIALVETYLIP